MFVDVCGDPTAATVNRFYPIRRRRVAFVSGSRKAKRGERAIFMKL